MTDHDDRAAGSPRGRGPRRELAVPVWAWPIGILVLVCVAAVPGLFLEDVEVYVAREGIGEYQQIGEEDLNPRSIPAHEAEGAIREGSDIVGRLARVPIAAGSVIRGDMITAVVDDGKLKSRTVVAIVATESAASDVAPGSTVDILLAPTTEGDFETLVVANAVLLGIEANGDERRYFLAVRKSERDALLAAAGRAQLTLLAVP